MKRAWIRAVPFAAVAGVCFWLLPHESVTPGPALPRWPAWAWFDAVGVAVVWLVTARIFVWTDAQQDLRIDARLSGGRDAMERQYLWAAAVHATAVVAWMAVLWYVVPRPLSHRDKWFEWDYAESFAAVTAWVMVFLLSWGEQRLDARRTGGRNAGAGTTAATNTPEQEPRSADWLTLRHVLLEASVGRKAELPVRLREHPAGVLIGRFHQSGDRGLLDQAAVELAGTPDNAWKVIARR